MKTLYFSTLLILLLACDKTIGTGAIKDLSIRLLYVDSEGAAIIEKVSPEFDWEEMRVYYYNNEMEYTLRYDGRLHSPYFIEKYDSGILTILPIFGEEDGTYIEGGKSTSYLDFGNGDIDTLQVSGIIDGSIQRITNVWYNGTKVMENWECGELPGCAKEIVK